MADASEAAAGVQNLHLDEVTGERVSKSELKRRKKAREQEEKAKKQAVSQAASKKEEKPVEDTATANYGEEAPDNRPTTTTLGALTEAQADKEVTIFLRVANTRSQSAKLAFLMLRDQGKSIQAVVAASPDGAVSRQMVKWAVGISTNSYVRVTALVQKPKDPVASASLSTLELHIKKIYVISRAMQMLPMQVKDAERPPPESSEEGQLDAEGVPIVTLKTRLDNRVLDLQTECNQAIFTISNGVEMLFQEYMWKSGSRKFNTSKLVGAATEGGSEVFEVGNYFGKKAYLAQSPQLPKQMLIAADCRSVFEIGPVFRAENSNTHRHLTEVSYTEFAKLLAGLTSIVYRP